MVPQRRSISALTASRDSCFSCSLRGEILIHGSPCLLTIATPPVGLSARACSKRSKEVLSLALRAVMNSPASCGWSGPRSGPPGCPRSGRAGRPPGCATGSRPPFRSPASAARPAAIPTRTARTGCARSGPCRPPPLPATARAPSLPVAPSPPDRRMHHPSAAAPVTAPAGRSRPSRPVGGVVALQLQRPRQRRQHPPPVRRVRGALLRTRAL